MAKSVSYPRSPRNTNNHGVSGSDLTTKPDTFRRDTSCRNCKLFCVSVCATQAHLIVSSLLNYCQLLYKNAGCPPPRKYFAKHQGVARYNPALPFFNRLPMVLPRLPSSWTADLRGLVAHSLLQQGSMRQTPAMLSNAYRRSPCHSDVAPTIPLLVPGYQCPGCLSFADLQLRAVRRIKIFTRSGPFSSSAVYMSCLCGYLLDHSRFSTGAERSAHWTSAPDMSFLLLGDVAYDWSLLDDMVAQTITNSATWEGLAAA